MRTLLTALLMASTVLGQNPQAPTKAAPQQGPPPKNLTVRADGHVTANQDPTNPDKFEVHVVKQGETLSQISGEVLKNQRFWPQLWEQNEHIINPHWIYPNDKVLIRPVTAITEAKPPEPELVPQVVVEPPPPPRRAPAPAPAQAAPAPAREFILAEQQPVSEVKFDDLYCSGFVQTSPVPKDLKVISKFDATGVLSTQLDYVYLSQGSEAGIAAGNVYQVVRPTRALRNPYGRTKADRELGMHYLDVGQLRVVLTQADFSLARVIHSCADAVDVGDILLPFKQVVLPARARPRPFSPMMTTTGGVSGSIVYTKNVLLSYGSTFKVSSTIPGVRTGRLGAMERGIASEGEIVYLDLGQDKVKAGDIFIAYRKTERDDRLYDLPKETEKLKGTRTAIGELLVVKVGERGSTAVVTYAADALVPGDAVERR